MHIQILGSGCATCQKLHSMVTSIVKEKDQGDTVEYITGDAGTSKIIELGVMSSPVLLVDNKIVMVGFIPDLAKVKAKIYGHL